MSRLVWLGVLAAAVLQILLPSTSVAQAPLRIGEVYLRLAKDPLDDTDRSIAFVIDDNTKLALSWRCMSTGLNVLVESGYMAGDDKNRVVVRYRFDMQTASEPHFWNLAGDKKAAYLDPEQVVTFTEQAKSAHKLVVRVIDPLTSDVTTGSFLLGGLSGALKALSCARE